ncbi:MAG TPA: PAS domain-containing protein [Candidatus Dormibacteraeota bacterium]|nr:PAS domain-containing protein [Candidatus Dormibacteraeota bacterium]
MATDSAEPRPQAIDAAAQAVPQSSEQVFRLVVDSIPGLVYTMTPGGEVEFVNRPILDYFGRTLEELKAWAMTDAVHPEDLPRVVAAWTRAVTSEEQYDIDQRLRRADGVYRWFHGRTRALRGSDDRIIRWYGLLTDIDDLKRTQEALQASEQRFRLIVDSVPGLVYTMTAAGEVELVNRQILEYFGRTLEELKGWTTTDAVHPDDLPRVIAAWRHALETGEMHEIEHRLRRADGAYRWFHLRAVPLFEGDGQIIRWYGLLTDIDDRRRADRRLRRAIKARYEAALAERTRIARDMHDGLLQDLTGIALQVGAALPHVRTSPDVAAERLERILESVERAGRGARQAVVGMREVSGSVDLVSAVQDEAQRLTTGATLALSMKVNGPVRLVPTVVRDVAVSIVHEAMTNVVKHANAQGVRVLVAFGGARVHLTVSDDGRGLTLPGRNPASHLGLAGMRERATSIGAALQVSSAPGSGTTLRLDVPLAPSTYTALSS